MAEPGDIGPEETAMRELEEETGMPGNLTDCVTWMMLVRDRDGQTHLISDEEGAENPPADPPPDLVYHLYVVTFPEEFVPKLDGEHTAYAWQEIDAGLRTLHPGCALAFAHLERFL
jgi:8-oxo-dGTP pyrophosphatase MutT (NUDIX family)